MPVSDLPQLLEFEQDSPVWDELGNACFACGACTARCPEQKVKEDWNPRVIIRKALFGLKDEVLSSEFIWICSDHYRCLEKCPQEVNIKSVMNTVRNERLIEEQIEDSTGKKAKKHLDLEFKYKIVDHESGKDMVYISRSKDLKNWEHPQTIFRGELKSGIKKIDVNEKSGKIHLFCERTANKTNVCLEVSGYYNRKWKLNKIPGKDKSSCAPDKSEYSRPWCSHYELETDSLRMLSMANWLNKKKQRLRIPAIKESQFLLVDNFNNIFISYDNKLSLTLPYFEKGPGLINLDLTKLHLDSDNDAIQDIDEIQMGLEPNNPDSDNDGLNDSKDADPTADNNAPHSQPDKIRQMAFEFIFPEAILHDSSQVINIIIQDGRYQWFENHKCKILCNRMLPYNNVQFNTPIITADNKAYLDITFTSPFVQAHGYTLSLSKTGEGWQVTGLDRVWREDDR
jgi:ferredoxin